MSERNFCPGVNKLARPVPEYLKCPVCGGTVEIWSDEPVGKCYDCGHELPRLTEEASCLEWCPYADKCREMLSNLKK